jgi:hypothetical protein
MSSANRSVPRRALAAATCAVFAVPAVLWAASAGPDTQLRHSHRAIEIVRHGLSANGHATLKPRSELPRRLRDTFAILRSTRVRSDLDRPDAPLMAAIGARPEDVRRAQYFKGQPFYVVPGRRVVCVSDPYYGGDCNSIKFALRGEVLGAFELSAAGPNGTIRIFGLVPDGVGKVRVKTWHGAGVSTLVHRNVFVVDTPSAPRWIYIGERRLASPYPRYGGRNWPTRSARG